MSRKLTFFGASDDLFEVEGSRADEPDEIGCYNETVVLLIRDGDESMQVTGEYVSGGVWAVGISPADEGSPKPDWPMSWEFRDYTARLTLDVPDSAEVLQIEPEHAYSRGKLAFHQGKLAKSNPYDENDGDDRKQWFQGWANAQSDGE